MTEKLKEQLSNQEEAKLKNLNDALAAVVDEEACDCEENCECEDDKTEENSLNEAPAVADTPVEAIEQPEEGDQVASLEERVTALEEGQSQILDVLEKISEKVLAPAAEEAPAQEMSLMNEAEKTETEEQVSAEENESEEAPADEESVEAEVENAAEEAEENTTEEEVEVNDTTEATEEEEESVKDEAETEVENSTEEVEAKETVEETAEEEGDAEEKEADEEIKEENAMTDAEINALVARIKNEILDEKVEAPEVKEVEEKKEENSFSSNWRVRYNQQVAAAWDAHRLKSAAGLEKLQKINAVNYNELVKAGKVNNDIDSNPITMESLGGFILPPEVDTMIHGKRTDYSALLDNINIDETTSLQFAYATRVGDIEMRPVKLCQTGGTIADDENHVRPDNLKPIETYELVQGLAQLEEMAAVTPICTSVTRFAAADILADVAAGYRTSYDRGMAQLFVIRLQQAVDATDNLVEFDPASATDALIDFVKATTKVSDSVVNGKFLFNAKTKAAILEFLFNAGNGGDLTTNAFTNGDVPSIFGYPYIVVPNDLLPTLGEGDKRTFVAQTLDGTKIETVDITSPVFYGDFDEYRGKTHGGLSYDVSAEASYEVYGPDGVQEVRSAWQRNELVLRGSYYRGGYIADPTVIAGMIPVSS